MLQISEHEQIKMLYSVSSVDRDGSRLPGKLTDLDLVRVWESDEHAESVYVLPAWYFIVDRSARRLHAIDPPVYRRLAAAAAKTLARRWRQTLLRSGGSLRRSNRDVESTATGVQLSQLLVPQDRALSNTLQ